LEVGKQVVGFIYLFYRVDLMQPFLKELEEGASNEQADTYVLYERARLLLGNYKLQQAEEAFLKISRPEDGTGVVTKRDLLNSLGTVYYFQGNWKKALVCFQEGLANSRERKQDSAYNHMRIAKLYLVQGLINQAEKEFLIALDELQDMNEELLTPARVCYGLGDICVIDGRYNAALEWYDKSLGVLRQIKAWRDVIIALLNKSVLLSILGKSEESFEIVEEALKLAEEIKDERGVALAKCKFGDLTLLEKRWDKALNYYRESRAGFMAVEDNYFLVQTNLRIAIAREVPLDNPEMVSLCNEAESFCTKYEYWDQFAILQLVRANALWSTPGVHGANNWEVSLNYYQKAMIYALHYNRFALDEVLRGGELATPLLPIIPNCLERGEEGRNMLTALHDWWQSGKSELGVSRPDAILPLPEGMSLVEAERIAREREPGDGSPQKTVLEQIEKALSQGKFNS
jgi:tetratricopeptide (TPR) repeat protein